ncbi:MAG: hypothetical protein K2I95_02275 [Treponemataceae bacterium]|nr:hypothetical protein [Treponemataceae bacterium]
MKKLIGTAMLAALLATSAFAELSVGVWLRQLWSPVAYNGGDVLTNSQNSWGAGRTGNIGLTWVSEDEKAGAQLAFIYNPWHSKITDDGLEAISSYSDAFDMIESDGNRLIWVKPWDWIKLSLGHWDGINDIQVANTASWDWLRPGTWLGFKGARADNLYAENEATGALFEITPVEDLMIRVGLPFLDGDKSYHMFEALTADVEYTIPDIMKIMVGWRGGAYAYAPAWGGAYADYKVDGDWGYTGEIDVFLGLIAVENLQLDVGARIAIADYDVLQEEVDKVLIGVKAGYSITDNISVKADFAVKISEIQDPSFAFGVGVGVGLTDSLSLDADFRALIPGDTNGVSTDPTFSFLVGLNYACSTNAILGIGFQGKTNGGAIGPLSGNEDNFGFAVPIKVQVSF